MRLIKMGHMINHSFHMRRWLASQQKWAVRHVHKLKPRLASLKPNTLGPRILKLAQLGRNFKLSGLITKKEFWKLLILYTPLP